MLHRVSKKRIRLKFIRPELCGLGAFVQHGGESDGRARVRPQTPLVQAHQHLKEAERFVFRVLDGGQPFTQLGHQFWHLAHQHGLVFTRQPGLHAPDQHGNQRCKTIGVTDTGPV